MAQELAAEKAKSAALTKKLKKIRRNNQVSAMNKQLASKGENAGSTDSSSFDFEGGNEFTSTRNTTRPDQDEPRINWHSMAEASQEQSKFLSSMNQLSVASISVPECKPTDDGDIHRQTYETWKDLLIDSLKLAGIEDEHTMFTVFKVKAGIKLLEIFRNTKTQQGDPDPESRAFSNAMQRLKSYFGSGSDIMLMRRKLALMAQKVDETDLAYITRVGSMARLCGWDEAKEFEEIVATVAEHAREKEVRTSALKMLSMKGSFTDFVDKVREIESIRLNEEYVMRKRERPDKALVASISTPFNHQSNFQHRYRYGESSQAGVNDHFRHPQQNANRYQNLGHPYQRQMQTFRGRRRAPTGGHFVGNKTGQISGKCWRCESVFHSPNECSAKEKACNYCGQIGHIRRACQARFTKTDPFAQRLMKADEESHRQIATLEKIEHTPTEEEAKVSDIIEN